MANDTHLEKARWTLLNAEPGQKTYGKSLLAFESLSAGPAQLVFRTFEVDERDGMLRFHPYLKSVKAVNQPVLCDAGDLGLKSRIPILGHQEAYALLQTVNDLLQLEKSSAVPVAAQERIPAEGLTPELFLNDRGELQFRVVAQTAAGPIEIWNLSRSVEWVLSWVNGGIGSATGYKNTDLANRRRGEKRERDLKVLKHAGLAALLFHEVMASISEAPTPKGKRDAEIAIRRRERRVFDVLGKTLGLLEKQPLGEADSKAISFDRLCSKNVHEIVSELISEVSLSHDFSAVPVFGPDGLIFVEGIPRLGLRILYALLAASVSGTKGSLFAKVRTGAFDSFFSAKISGNEPVERDFICQPLRTDDFSPPPKARRYMLTEPHRSARAALNADASSAR